MKNNKFLNIAAGIAFAVGATGCSSDYLDLEPMGTLDYEEVLENAQGATLAAHGLCNSMYKQYSALYDYYWFNGEPWLSMYYGEVMGQDYISWFWFRAQSELGTWYAMNVQSQGAQVAWSYCYGLISQANNILTFAPKKGVNGETIHYGEEGEVLKDANGNPVPDIDGEYAFRYAQALTFRAHAYTRLMQIYAPRWEDRFKSNGVDEKLTVPLRLEYVTPEGNMDKPCVTMSAVMDQIYADLNQAIELYELSGTRRQYLWEPDEQVCKGIFARAALLRNDYKTAQQMAHEARQGYEIMTSDEYLKGFAEPNGEWMWTNSGEAQGIYYASFGATYACNGAYPCLWGQVGAGAIDNDLLNQVSSTFSRDVRTSLYYGPVNSYAQVSRFWGDGCDSQTLNINGGSLHNDFVTFATNRYNNVAEFGWYPPYTYQGSPMGAGPGQTTCLAQFGAQFKFWGTDGYSTSYFPFMRASEMLLIEAEAAWQNFDEKTALNLCNELNSMRVRANANYRDANYSGDELMDWIKLSRRFELWGEGFSWFDYKRWNEPIIRRAWVSGDQTSGNWPSRAAQTFETTVNRGWRWRIPSTEYNYNHAIDQAWANSNADE